MPRAVVARVLVPECFFARRHPGPPPRRGIMVAQKEPQQGEHHNQRYAFSNKGQESEDARARE